MSEVPRSLQPWPDPQTPALAIVARGDQIAEVSPAEYAVCSQSRPPVKYVVSVEHERWRCTCAFFHAWRRACIHILAVRYREGFRERRASIRPDPECERCLSSDVVHDGRRWTRTGATGRLRCRTCGYRFADRNGSWRQRSDPNRIAVALDLYFRGLSLRKVAEHLDQAYGLKLSPQTIHSWITRYSRLASRWMDSFKVRTGKRWHVDETFVNVDGGVRYLWNVLDADSRFLLSTHISRGRGIREAQTTLAKAKRVTLDRPMEVLTDGLPAYPEAVGRTLGTGRGRWFKNPHRRVPSIRARVSNNPVERLHGTEKERLKVMRGMESVRSASQLLDGFRVHYNMVREHGSLKSTPAVAAGLPDPGGFRWREILREASRPRRSGRRRDPVELVFIVTR